MLTLTPDEAWLGYLSLCEQSGVLLLQRLCVVLFLSFISGQLLCCYASPSLKHLLRWSSLC